jgi:hypothetical protein
VHGHPLRRDTKSAPAVATLPAPTGAVAWIDRDRAVVARSATTGKPVVHELFRVPRRPAKAAVSTTPEVGPFLARVVDEIGDRDRVVIMGPDAMRVELEREYVTINRHPDRLVDVEDAAELDREDLIGRLARLTVA